jgi:thioesterase domain-containing protein
MPSGFNGKPSLPTIEAMAEESIRHLVTLQPQGPYFLGGFCNGAYVAYEMARQMEQQGLVVGLVILVEAGAPRYFDWLRALVHGGGRLARLSVETQTRVYAQLRKYLVRTDRAHHQGHQAVLKLFLQTARKKLLGLLGTPPENRGVQIPALDDRSQYSIIQLYRQFGLIALNYKPKPYRGRVVLLRTKSVTDSYPADRTTGWGNLASQIEIHDLPGTHATCQTEHVGVLAEHIGRSLRACHEDSQMASAQYRNL